MTKRVLDVGQCQMDHGTISNFLQAKFAAEVSRAHVAEDALAELRRQPYDLVLVNRKLDRDYSDGLAIVRSMKADPALADVPVMLVTNYPDQQQIAVAAGALPGFGKAELHTPETLERLRHALA